MEAIASDNAEKFREVKAAEGLFDDEVIYVSTQGSRIGLNGGRIAVTAADTQETVSSFPVEKVRTVNVFGNISVSTPFLASCGKAGMSVNYFTWYGKYVGSFVPEQNTIAEVRRRQAALGGEQALMIAQAIVGAKIRNSRTLLSRKKVRPPERMKVLEANVHSAGDMNQLRGIEGEAAALYFGCLGDCLVEGWTFEKRTRRPPQDHINSLLSLTYAMMKNEVMSALRQYNLDPFIGVMHRPTGRPARPSISWRISTDLLRCVCYSAG